VRIDVKRDQSFQVEFLFLQSILVRILVELESDKLNDQFLRCEDNCTDEQGEQDIGDSRQVVSADLGSTLVSTNDQRLECDPGCEHPYDQFTISTEVPDYVFVFLGRWNDGTDCVSPKVRENHEYCGGCPESAP
jgi:hypothetical protein